MSNNQKSRGSVHEDNRIVSESEGSLRNEPQNQINFERVSMVGRENQNSNRRVFFPPSNNIPQNLPTQGNFIQNPHPCNQMPMIGNFCVNLTELDYTFDLMRKKMRQSETGLNINERIKLAKSLV